MEVVDDVVSVVLKDFEVGYGYAGSVFLAGSESLGGQHYSKTSYAGETGSQIPARTFMIE